ncbi:MAG: isoprenylcysteine carboxylmethyltransferase family protein [Pseudomonadota bacterium]
MKLRIPPPVLMVVTGVVMWVAARSPFDLTIMVPFAVHLSRLFMVLGAAVALIAAWQFTRAKTTIDPFHPERSSRLVSHGIFAVSRNPMYLGMALVLGGLVVRLGSVIAGALLIVFVLIITQFQIKPEEKALTALFGNAYRRYCEHVRRWI